MAENPQGQNRRLSERKDAAFSLYYSIETPFELRITLGIPDEVAGLMQDLSELGAAILTKYDIPVNTFLRLRFNLLNSHLTGEDRLRKMNLIAEVMSNQTLPDESHRLGIRFEKISKQDKAAITEYVSFTRS